MGATNLVTKQTQNSDEHLDTLLAELNLDEDVIVESSATADKELIIHEPDMVAAVDTVDDTNLDAEAFGYVEDAPVAAVAEAPLVDTKPAKKAKAPKEPKEPKEPKAAKVKAEPKAPKAPVERKHYSSKVERLTDKLGATLGDNIVLEVADAMLTGDALQTKQAATLATIMSSGKKVQNRQTFIIEFVSGKSAKLNNVITTALQVLKKHGSINMSADGEFYKALIAKPYSVNAAKAMGGNTVLAMKTLKMLKEEGGKFVANPNSLIMTKLASMGVY